MTIAEQLRAEGEKKGRLEGRLEGKLEGERELLRKQLTRRFGSLPSWVDAKLVHADVDALEDWSMRVLDATTLEAFFSEQH